MSVTEPTYRPEGYTYAFPRPGMSAEIVLLAGRGQHRTVLLGERRRDPCRGMWALPGGHVEAGESAEQAAARELSEESGIIVAVAELVQVRAFTAPDRAANWVIGIAHLLLTDAEPTLTPNVEEWSQLRFWALGDRPRLGFDHDAMLDAAVTLADQLTAGAPGV